MSDPSQLIAFTHIAKNAGTSFHDVLRRSYGMRYVVVSKRFSDGDQLLDSADLRRLKRRYWNLRAFGGHPVAPYTKLARSHPEIIFVTMLRDPISRCASHYAHDFRKGNTDLPFLAWLESDQLDNYQSRRLVGEPDGAAAIKMIEERFLFVGLVETFEESIRILQLHLPAVALIDRPVYRNRSMRRDLRDAVLADPEARKAIIATHQEDFRLYSHVRDEIWPAQAAMARVAPPAGVQALANTRRRMSLAKERAVLGIPRRLARAGINTNKHL